MTNLDIKNGKNKALGKKIIFPRDFLFGSATSSHQTEGGNINNWSKWESENAKDFAIEAVEKNADWQKRKFPEMFNPKNYISGKTCDHFNRYEEDFDILEKLNHNSYRFSLEWSRIEPEEGVFDQDAIRHYRKVLVSLKNRKVKPMVTLWHWTNPIWLAKKGGEVNRQFPFYFSRYAKFIVAELGDLVDLWITLNEPTTVVVNGYLQGRFPPGKKNPFLAKKVFRILAKAHNKAYDEIHLIQGNAQVSFSNYFVFYKAFGGRFYNEAVAKFARHFGHREFFNLTVGKFDFVAIQYYGRVLVRFPWKFIRDRRYAKKSDDLGWEIYPEGLYYILKKLKKYDLPIYITENGLADNGDQIRERFIKNHLYWVYKSIEEGVDVRGYYYWSLLDNFEWDKGYWPRFGLVEVDFRTMSRKIRKSAFEYAKICRDKKFYIDERNLL